MAKHAGASAASVGKTRMHLAKRLARLRRPQLGTHLPHLPRRHGGGGSKSNLELAMGIKMAQNRLVTGSWLSAPFGMPCELKAHARVQSRPDLGTSDAEAFATIEGARGTECTAEHEPAWIQHEGQTGTSDTCPLETGEASMGQELFQAEKINRSVCGFNIYCIRSVAVQA